MKAGVQAKRCTFFVTPKIMYRIIISNKQTFNNKKQNKIKLQPLPMWCCTHDRERLQCADRQERQ